MRARVWLTVRVRGGVRVGRRVWVRVSVMVRAQFRVRVRIRVRVRVSVRVRVRVVIKPIQLSRYPLAVSNGILSGVQPIVKREELE